jgi:hypothetical protein
MDAMIALILIITVVVLAAFAESFGADTRDYETHTLTGDLR